VFPNDGQVARVGLTMPIGLDLDTVEDREDYALLRPEDDRVPAGKEYISRLLEYAYPSYDAEEFPLLEDRGKAKGTETYPISSTRPIESPTKANVAVVGGAMGATSAFHEGGDHVAIRSGKEAGRLAGLGALRAYNYEWRRAIGEEVRRNVVLADMVRDYRPSDWDRVFGLASAMQPDEGGRTDWFDAIRAGPGALRLFAQYQYGKFRNRDGGYCQIREDDYSV
jgi:flavin-dependent dehydrogenase